MLKERIEDVFAHGGHYEYYKAPPCVISGLHQLPKWFYQLRPGQMAFLSIIDPTSKYDYACVCYCAPNPLATQALRIAVIESFDTDQSGDAPPVVGDSPFYAEVMILKPEVCAIKEKVLDIHDARTSQRPGVLFDLQTRVDGKKLPGFTGGVFIKRTLQNLNYPNVFVSWEPGRTNWYQFCNYQKENPTASLSEAATATWTHRTLTAQNYHLLGIKSFSTVEQNPFFTSSKHTVLGYPQVYFQAAYSPSRR